MILIPILALISLTHASPKAGIVGDALSGQNFGSSNYGSNQEDFYGQLPYEMLVQQYGLLPRDLEYFGHMGIYPLSTGGCSCPRPLIPQIMGGFNSKYPLNNRPYGNNFHHSSGGKHQMGGYHSDEHLMDNHHMDNHHMGGHMDEHHLGDIFDDHHMEDHHMDNHHMGGHMDEQHLGDIFDDHHMGEQHGRGGYGTEHKDMQMGNSPYLSGRGNFEEGPKVGAVKNEPVLPVKEVV